ncbi:MAG: hypothetical protein D6815_02720 [Candidatus Dadabacteria bacterium]|nr:MAG: hypothetical protein D6815_02720 [Candidatus Dadabacteria bacterium]
MTWIARHWQDVLVWAALAAAAGYLARRAYRALNSPGAAACEACPAHRKITERALRPAPAGTEANDRQEASFRPKSPQAPANTK